MKHRKPMLQPHHFDGGSTRMTGHGLSLNTSVGHADREAACLDLGETFDEIESQLDSIAASRPASRVLINPPRYSASRLMSCMTAAQKAAKNDRFNLTHGLSDRYERRWSRQWESDLDVEGQTLVIVAFDSCAPVGFVGFSISLIHPEERGPSYFLSFSFGLVYVAPARRGMGYGLDLSVATGWVVSDVLSAVYRSVPARATITPNIYADWETRGGELFTYHIRDSLDVTADMLMQERQRKSIKVGRTRLDAGY